MKRKRGDRPRIGITGPDKGGSVAWIFSALAVFRAGGRPWRITPARPSPVAELDGLILGGGVDLEPAIYGGKSEGILEEIKEESRGGAKTIARFLLFPFIFILRRMFSLKSATDLDGGRDALEVRLLREALERGLPVLGICRGSQLINAVMGGTLHREIRGFYTETPYFKSVLPRKKITVVPGTILATIFPLGTYRVNALNHQAVDQTAPDLRVAATEGNGLTQAIEHATLPFILGVQWHPEYLPHLRAQQRIFRKLVRQARQLPAAEPADGPEGERARPYKSGR